MTGQDYRALDASKLNNRPFPTVQQELRIVLAEEAFDRIVSRGNANLTCEVGGILVGQVLRDDSGPYVLVETTIDAMHAEERGAEVLGWHRRLRYLRVRRGRRRREAGGRGRGRRRLGR